jgi:hypothetical protein
LKSSEICRASIEIKRPQATTQVKPNGNNVVPNKINCKQSKQREIERNPMEPMNQVKPSDIESNKIESNEFK